VLDWFFVYCFFILFAFILQLKISRLEQLCIQYLESCIGVRNVLVALQNAAKLGLDFVRVSTGRGRRVAVDTYFPVCCLFAYMGGRLLKLFSKVLYSKNGNDSFYITIVSNNFLVVKILRAKSCNGSEVLFFVSRN